MREVFITAAEVAVTGCLLAVHSLAWVYRLPSKIVRGALSRSKASPRSPVPEKSSSVVLSKCDLIDAVLTKPFLSNHFLEANPFSGNTIGDANSANDRVCAVGAMLSDHVDPSTSKKDFRTLCAGAIAQNANGGSYDLFPELITFFDKTLPVIPALVRTEHRFAIADYVESHFPDKVLIVGPGRRHFVRSTKQ